MNRTVLLALVASFALFGASCQRSPSAGVLLVCPAEDPACPPQATSWQTIEAERTALPPLVERSDRVAAGRQIGERIGQAAALSKRYQPLTAGGSPTVAVAAMWSVGELHRDLAAAIRRLPCPAGTERPQCEALSQAYATQAAPLEQEALRSFNEAVRLAEALPADSPWRARVAQSQAAQLTQTNAAALAAGPGETVVELADEPAEPRDGLTAIRAAGALRVAVAEGEADEVPRVGSLRAVERHIAEAVASELGVALRYVVVPSTADPFAALKAGQVELVTPSWALRRTAPEGLWHSTAAAKTDELIVGGRRARRPRRLDDLVGLEIGVVAGAPLQAKLEGTSLGQGKRLNLKGVPSSVRAAELLDGVVNGELAAAAVSRAAVEAELADNEELAVLWTVGTAQPVHWWGRPAGAELGRVVDAAIFAGELTTHRQKQYEGGLAEIKRRKVLRVAMLNNAASYFVYRGQEVGFQYEMAALLAARLGVRLEVVVPDKPADMAQLVRDGRVDLIPISGAGVAEPTLAYSEPFIFADHVLVQPATEVPITEAAALRGRIVHLRRTSAYVPRLTELAAEVGVGLVFVDESLETEELIGQVGRGELPLTVSNTVLLSVERLFRDDVQGTFVLSHDEPLVYGMRREADELLARVNALIVRERKGPTYRAIVARYFDNPKRMQQLRAEESSTSQRISPYDDLARKYGARYGVDWRLILAQMYNESRFDPAATSWVGARGLMQLMPRTAKELRVKRILDPEQNVEAGVRYLAGLIAQTESSLPMRQRVRFALAGYNAGMGHVRDARLLARRLKLDPDRWFGGVEKAIVLLEKPAYHRRARYGYCRGSEPVAYVSRIQTKYDAYQALMPATAPTPGD